MIRSRGTIFENDRKKTPQIQHASDKGLDGDSGVGQAPEFPSKSLQARVSQQKPKSKKRIHFFYTSHLLSRLGTVLLIFSLIGFLFTYGPIIQVEIGYRLSKLFAPQTVSKGSFADILDKTLLGEIEGVPDPNFSLIIPKIHAKSKVIERVDPANESAYLEALKSGIAHADGTAFPGENGTIYLFAHSTDSPINILRYNAVFYLLRELEVGDEVDIYYKAVRHRYQVTDKKIVEPTDVTYLSRTNPQQQELLILQTCWPPGTTLKRLLIFAQKAQ